MPHFDHSPRPGEIDSYILWMFWCGNGICMAMKSYIVESYNRALYLKNRHDNNQYMYVYLCAAWNIDRGLWIWYSPKRRHKSFFMWTKIAFQYISFPLLNNLFLFADRQNINKKDVLLFLSDKIPVHCSGFWNIFFWINTHFILWMDRPRKNYRLSRLIVVSQ